MKKIEQRALVCRILALLLAAAAAALVLYAGASEDFQEFLQTTVLGGSSTRSPPNITRGLR